MLVNSQKGEFINSRVCALLLEESILLVIISMTKVIKNKPVL